MEQFPNSDDLESFIKQVEEKSQTKFITFAVDRHYNDKDWQPLSVYRVHWKWAGGSEMPAIEFTGVPFMFVGCKRLVCHQGKDLAVAQKQRYAEEKAKKMMVDQSFAKQRFVHSKKVGCPAAISIRKIARFPKFKVDNNKEKSLKKASKMLRVALERDPIVWETCYAVTHPSAHVGHQTRYTKIDQVNLETLFQKWRAASPVDKFHLRLHTEEAPFLLCHQTAWQMRLLRRYGTDICWLDAAYRTTRYALPLFFLCVRTNVCYIVVGVMVVQEETTEAIKEGLEVFKRWNTDWKPAHFMVHCSVAEIKAVESVFEGTKALLSDFHREKAWGEWTRKQDHQVFNKEYTLAKMRAVARADNIEEYEKAVKALMDSQTWNENLAFQNWFLETWLSEAKRWAAVFKAEALNFAITTDDGIKHQNEAMKHKYLEAYKDSTLSEMLEVVVQKYIPELQRKYIEGNVRSSSSYKRYNADVYPFLWDRPTDIVQHITSRMEISSSGRHVVQRSYGIFSVKSDTRPGRSYRVSFGTEDSLPSCQCEDWRRYLLPCEHFCSVFNYVPGWTWQQLSPKYREHPLLNLDATCCSSTSDSADTEVVNQPVNCEGTHGSSNRSLSPRRRARKTYLRKRCANLTKQIMDKISITEDQDTLEELSETLSTILKDLTPLTSNEDELPLHLGAKRIRPSPATPSPLSQR